MVAGGAKSWYIQLKECFILGVLLKIWLEMLVALLALLKQ